MRSIALILAALSVACTTAAGDDPEAMAEPLPLAMDLDASACESFATDPIDAVALADRTRECLSDGGEINWFGDMSGWSIVKADPSACQPDKPWPHAPCESDDLVCHEITLAVRVAVGLMFDCEADGGSDCESPEQINDRADATIADLCG